MRKFQVFVSATFDDLQDERNRVFFSIMTARQVPVGMEVFGAADDRGWKVIQRIIDTSDYYVVIVAGRYGSIDETTGTSWTEREYRYAGEKGIKRLAFIRKDSAITADKMDQGEDAQRKQELLRAFKATLRGSHLCERWESGEELARKVSDALRNQIQDDEADGAQPPGWVRGGDTLGVATELARLSDENRSLRETVASLQAPSSVSLSIAAAGAAPDGSVRITIPHSSLAEERQVRGPGGLVLPVLAGFGPRREDITEYLDKKNRAAIIHLYIDNKGESPATEVEVRIDISEASDVDTELRRPTGVTIPVAHRADPRRTGARNVVIESENLFEDGSARVVQRVRLIAPGSDAELIPFYAVAIGDGPEFPFEIAVTAINSNGARTTAKFAYLLVWDGEQIVQESAFL